MATFSKTTRPWASVIAEALVASRGKSKDGQRAMPSPTVSGGPQPPPLLSSFIKDTHTLMCSASPFTVARTWKQCECLLTEEQIEEVWYRHTMEYYSAIKRNETLSFVEMWMDQRLSYRVKVKVTQSCLTLCDPIDCIVSSRPEYWNG